MCVCFRWTNSRWKKQLLHVAMFGHKVRLCLLRMKRLWIMISFTCGPIAAQHRDVTFDLSQVARFDERDSRITWYWYLRNIRIFIPVRHRCQKDDPRMVCIALNEMIQETRRWISMIICVCVCAARCEFARLFARSCVYYVYVCVCYGWINVANERSAYHHYTALPIIINKRAFDRATAN